MDTRAEHEPWTATRRNHRGRAGCKSSAAICKASNPRQHHQHSLDRTQAGPQLQCSYRTTTPQVQPHCNIPNNNENINQHQTKTDATNNSTSLSRTKQAKPAPRHRNRCPRKYQGAQEPHTSETRTETPKPLPIQAPRRTRAPCTRTDLNRHQARRAST
jgi:hypothetical protein